MLNHTPATTITDGHKRVNWSDALSALVAATSLKIAISRYMYFILLVLHAAEPLVW
jgi:hypothetical protein